MSEEERTIFEKLRFPRQFYNHDHCNNFSIYIFKDDTKFYVKNDPRLKRKCGENKPSMKSMGEINLNVPCKKNKCLNFFPFIVLHHVFYFLC